MPPFLRVRIAGGPCRPGDFAPVRHRAPPDRPDRRSPRSQCAAHAPPYVGDASGRRGRRGRGDRREAGRGERTTVTHHIVLPVLRLAQRCHVCVAADTAARSLTHAIPPPTSEKRNKRADVRSSTSSRGDSVTPERSGPRMFLGPGVGPGALGRPDPSVHHGNVAGDIAGLRPAASLAGAVTSTPAAAATGSVPLTPLERGGPGADAERRIRRVRPPSTSRSPGTRAERRKEPRGSGARGSGRSPTALSRSVPRRARAIRLGAGGADR